MPVENRSRLTDTYGWQDWRRYSHLGLDFGGPSAGTSTKAMAAADGVVEFVGWDLVPLRHGQHIGIRHPDGSLTFYGHVRWPKVRAGQHVKRGDWIADTWHTGLKITAGIHLHFEWWRDADNHRSTFDPTKRLAEYGWVFKWDTQAGKYRMHDQWEGRAHATPLTLTPAKTPTTTATEPTTEGLTVSQYEDLKAGQAELNRKIDRVLNSLGGANITITASNGKSYRTNQNGALKVIETLVRQSNTVDKDNAEGIDELLERVAEPVGTVRKTVCGVRRFHQ